MPLPEFRVALKALPLGCDLRHVRTLTNKFGVSHEMMAQIYVGSVDKKAAIITSHNCITQRLIAPVGFPYLGLSIRSPLPRQALARQFKPTDGETTSQLVEVLTDRWLNERGSITAIYEQVALQQDGWATTLLVVEEEEQDDDGDDRDWNRRNSRR